MSCCNCSTKVEVYVVNSSRNPLPEYKSDQASGMDLYANIDGNIVLAPGTSALIPTGISTVLPDGYEFQIRSRSGLAFKNGVTVLNAPGTINTKINRTVVINNRSNHFC